MKNILKATVCLLAAAIALWGCGKRPSDKEILTLIYNSLGGENWKEAYKLNWNSDAPLSDWSNVTVDEEGRVTSLAISEGSGKIPPEIAKLTNLKSLRIYIDNGANGIADCIPEEIGKLAGLEDLSLTIKGVDAKIPSLAGMTGLKKLNLSVGKVPYPDLTGLNNLEEVELEGFAGPFPESLCSLSKIHKVYVRSAYFEGGIPDKISDLKGLTFLLVDNTAGFTPADGQGDVKLPESLFTMDGLDYLWLRSCANCGSIPSSIDRMQNLSEMVLINLGLSGSIPSQIGSVPYLNTLEVYNNRISGKIPEEIGNLQKLKILWLQNNELSGELPHSIGKLENLESLQLQGNSLEGEIPSELADCKKLGNGVFVDLSDNRFTGNIPAAVKAMPKFGIFKF